MRKTRLFSILALLLMAVTGAWAQADMKKTPLTLKAKTAGTIVVTNPPTGMKYSMNGGDKTAVTSAPINVDIGETVQFFGNIASYGNSFTNITNGTADCYIYGNIMSLVDEEDFATATELTGDNAFRALFSFNSHLYNHDTYELVLPATTLTNYCYQDMFDGCTHLTKAPALPATTLASSCYSIMFFGCENLTTAPELPATTLAEHCYDGMFLYCENLTTAPVLPAGTLVEGCYMVMFAGCTKLNSVTCLATNISATDATSDWLADVAGTGTFTKAPGMEGWTTGFSGIPAGWTVVDNVPDMKKTPLTLKAKTAGTIVVSSPKSGMQYSKNGGVKTELTADAGYNSSYYKWTITVAIGDEVQFFGNGTSIASYYGTRISGGSADCYIYGNIMSLVDEDEYDTATELTGNDAFNSLFSYNYYLYNHPTYKLVLPATTLTESCYYQMFSDCTNLTTAPELPATTLATRCYMYMFNRCSNLNSVTCLATNISASSATNDWLKSVAADGTFIKAAGMEGWTTGASGIPAGWTVTDMKKTPLTLEAKTAGTIVVSNPPNCMQYSKNGGEKTAVTSEPITVAIGDKVQFFGDETNFASYGNTQTNISGGTADCYIYGNIMSLVDEENFATATTLTDDEAFSGLFSGNTHLFNHDTYELVLPATTLARNCYYNMFSGCTSLTTAPVLPATTLAEFCYAQMFASCTSLTTAPALPATTLARNCYYSMFASCTSLTTAPALPAMTLAAGCYMGMFNGCTNLTTAPALPATTLAESCYAQMFGECTNLTTAPALPAMTLAAGCYMAMFYSCTSLTTAPALPATTLAVSCYGYMFFGCTSLKSVTCLATDISADGALVYWLNGVAGKGTFTKAASTEGWTTGESGIPAGWTKNNIATLTDGSSIADQLKCPDELCEVNYTRSFTADKPSTVCLPFAYAPKTGEKFYTFSGITKDGDEYVATMTEHTGATLEANTPYLYKSATTGVTDFSGTYTIPATIAAGETASGDWKFVGTYETQEWTTAPTGIYGFSAQNTTGGISQGEFVKVGAYVRIKPMRAYLKYKDGGANYAGAPMMAPRRAAETLPERISVRLIDADGEVTGIGTLETRTGEVTLDGWYTLDGTRLSGQPTRKGIYVNNGKKVIIK